MEKPSKVKCPLCPVQFSAKGSLKTHLIKIHKQSIDEAKASISTLEESRFHCNLCNVKCRDRKVHETSKTHVKNIAKAKARAKICHRRHLSSGSEDEEAVSENRVRKRVVEKSSAEESLPSVKKRKVSVDEDDVPEVPGLVSDNPDNHRIKMVLPKPLRRRIVVSDDSEEEEQVETVSRKSAQRRPSVDTEVPRPARSEEFGEIFDTDKMWQEFKKATAPSTKGKKPKTYRIYKDKLENFEAFVQQSDPAFRLADTCNVGSTTRYRKLPSVIDWAESYESACSKTQAINAYKRFVKFIRSLIIRIEDKIPDNLRVERTNFLELKHSQANDIARPAAQLIETEKHSRKRQAALRAAQDNSAAPKGGYKELKSLVDKYRDSDFRTTWYHRCKDEGLKAVVRNYEWSKVDLRNWLMFEVFLESFGQRPDTVRNMTQLELFNATTMDDDKQNVVIEVKLHKTSSIYGPANVQIPAVLWDLVREFSRDIRETFRPLPDSGDYVFLTTTGKQMEDLSEAIQVFTAVVDPPFKVLPMHFREMCSTLGQTHPEVAVRNSVPLTMNHSQKTAERYYLDEGAKKSEHLGLKAKVFSLSKNLPKPNEDDSEANKRLKDELNRKDLESSTKVQKKRRKRRDY